MLLKESISVRNLPPEPIWYLAYGSNMRTASMSNRKITPLSTKAVEVPTHYVTFDVFGIPYSEPCYASIEKFCNEGVGKLQLTHPKGCLNVPPLCGIAHLLSPADFHRLLVTEGSGVVYEIIQLEAFALTGTKQRGERLTAYTLKAKWPQKPSGTPSARYLVCSRIYLCLHLQHH
jgi:hypothetical protein